MNPNHQALQHFLRLAFLRVRHQQQETALKAQQDAGNSANKTLNNLRILEEIIREQLIHEDTSSSTRASR